MKGKRRKRTMVLTLLMIPMRAKLNVGATQNKYSAATHGNPVPKRRKRPPFTSPFFSDGSAEEETQDLFVLDGSIAENRIKESFSDRGTPRLL